MYSNSILLDGSNLSQDYIEIGYHQIDYFITISGYSITIRGGGGGSLMDQSMEGAQVKQILSDFVHGKPRKESRYPNLPNPPIILSNEHGGPDVKGFVIFRRISGIPEALSVTMKYFINNILIGERSLILCNPQGDLFKRRNLLRNSTQSIVFGTREEIGYIMDIAQAVYRVQRKCYPNFKI